MAAVNPANPQTWDAYAYVANQPLEATDPLGLFDPAEEYYEARELSSPFTGLGTGWSEFAIYQLVTNPNVFSRDGISYTQTFEGGQWEYQASDGDVFGIGDPGTAGELGLPSSPVNGTVMIGMLQSLLSPPIWPTSGPAFVRPFSTRAVPAPVGAPPHGPAPDQLKTNAPTYSHSYLAQLACEGGSLLGAAASTIRGPGLIAIWGGIAAGAGKFALANADVGLQAVYDISVFLPIREHCVAAVDGPGYH
ncbi:MAG: hypothetical protein ACRD2E_08405 [Terriglobales bacterium]